jgi:hypothetical protein
MELTADMIIKYIAKVMDAPCSYGFGDVDVAEFMYDHCGDWCEQYCDTNSNEICWRKFLETMIKRGEADGGNS